jgi:uncharacterized protein (TIGR02996 family)
MTGPYAHPLARALLRAAKESPEDDGPRLALADWLEEQGDTARAEFLRLQLRLAPASPWALDPEARARARERVQELLARFGGGWLGPLWPVGGSWHRGLLAVALDRLRLPGHLPDIFPWTDSARLEVPGRDALRWALDLIAGAALNHATLDLRRPFPAEALRTLLAAAPEAPCLRTLTFRWSPGMGRLTGARALLALPDDFLARAVKELPLGRHLTHLGSSLPLTEAQARALRAAGAEPVLARAPHWPHALPPAAFGRRP